MYFKALTNKVIHYKNGKWCMQNKALCALNIHITIPQTTEVSLQEFWMMKSADKGSGLKHHLLATGLLHFDYMHISQECTALRSAAVVISAPLQCQAVKCSLHLPLLTVAPITVVQMTRLQARAAEEHALTGTEKGNGWWTIHTRPQS